MKGNIGNGLHNIIGINASAMIKNEGLKYCPACAREDKESQGVYYWHRLHQIPDLYICPEHKCELIIHVPNAIDLKRSFYIDANEVITELPPIQKASNLKLIDLSMLMSSILRGDSTFDINTVDYQSIIEKSIFSKGSGKIESAFIDSFIDFYGNDLIEMILPGLSTTWLKGIVKRPFHFFHPVRHLMMTTFLSQVPDGVPERLIFGNGPWPCLNKAADHYGKKVIKDIELHFARKTKKQIARLRCSCGMVYTKSYLNEKGKDRKEFIRIIAWGKIWLHALRQELSNKNSYRAIARKLGTDAKTISKYATHQTKDVKPKGKTILTNRRKWERLLEKFKTNRVISARRSNPALYIWLYRHDKLWFSNTNKANHSVQSNPELRLNWKELDKKIVDLIIETVDRLKKEKYRGRITKSLISKIIQSQHYLLGKNTVKLPKSNTSLNSLSESTGEFHNRRILESIEELRSTNQLRRWKVMQKAGLGKKVSASALQILNREFRYAS